CTILCLIFFFSSRRRHTRSKRDWSSDVCSSDLQLLGRIGQEILERRFLDLRDLLPFQNHVAVVLHAGSGGDQTTDDDVLLEAPRSEERRVGKECRSRGGPWR